MTAAWHLVTGEYPPDRGGVAAYTAVLARALAAAGREVHVWCGGPPREPDAGSAGSAGPTVHRVAGDFGAAGRRALAAGLDAFAGPRTLLVQYAPRAFGRDGTNLGFCRWVLGRRAVDDVRVLFHEPFFPFGRQPLRRNALAAVNHAMAALLLRAAHRAYVSTPAWEALLRPLAPRRLGRMRWLPIPSTVEPVDDPAAVRALREAAAPGGRPLAGHFGTYGGLLRDDLRAVLRAVLEGEPAAALLLLGAGGPEFADGLAAGDAALRARITAPGWLDDRALSIHLQALDVAVQPYPDGASARRTTLMTAIAHGIATVTTRGRFTEDEWTESGVPLVPAGDPRAAAARVLALLSDPPARRAAGAAGRGLYAARFAIHRTVAALLETADVPAEAAAP